MFQGNLRVTAKQKPNVDIRKIKGRESKHNTTENYQFRKENIREEERNKESIEQKSINKMAIISNSYR